MTTPRRAKKKLPVPPAAPVTPIEPGQVLKAVFGGLGNLATGAAAYQMGHAAGVREAATRALVSAAEHEKAGEKDAAIALRALSADLAKKLGDRDLEKLARGATRDASEWRTDPFADYFGTRRPS